MNNTTTVMLGVIIALVIGASGGYVVGASRGAESSDTKTQEAISMMGAQSASINEMGAMMKAGGMMLQDTGMRYKDDTLVQKGKDMQAIAEQHMGADAALSGGGTHNHMMGN